MTDPLRLSFAVGCPRQHAFAVWTSQMGTWWPADHTVTGDPAEVVLERHQGGRIYERTAEGVSYEWGEVTVWEPPRRLAYLWHLGRERADVTQVEIHFVDEGGERTRIEIEHSGWERLGDMADAWRDRNRTGWDTLLPHFAAAVVKGAA